MKGETGKQQAEHIEDIDGGLHPAVDGQSLDEDEDEEIGRGRGERNG